MPERLQKWLAQQGVGSRRELEALIADGRITVDGEVAVLGCKVSGTERITIDGRLFRAPRDQSLRPVVLIYNKPAGEICTRSDPQGRPTIFENLPRLGKGRWISVGRLDLQTAGLLLLTNDGELANKLMHPSSNLSREYSVRVLGNVSDAVLKQLRTGVDLEDGRARFDVVEFTGGEGRNRWYRTVVSEGRNRLVRRLWEAVDCRVSRLIRVRYGPIRLTRDISQGEHRFLRVAEKRGLYESVGLSLPE